MKDTEYVVDYDKGKYFVQWFDKNQERYIDLTKMGFDDWEEAKNMIQQHSQKRRFHPVIQPTFRTKLP